MIMPTVTASLPRLRLPLAGKLLMRMPLRLSPVSTSLKAKSPLVKLRGVSSLVLTVLSALVGASFTACTVTGRVRLVLALSPLAPSVAVAVTFRSKVPL